MTSVFDKYAAEAADLTAAPTDAQMAQVRQKCLELVAADQDVDRLEQELDAAKQKKNALQHKELPDLFGQLGIDKFGLPDAGEFGVDVELSPYYKASILAEWPDDQKDVAFNHLERIGGGDIIRTEVKFVLGRGAMDLARTLVAMIRLFGEKMQLEGVSDVPMPSISQGVPWNSLTSFVKERHAYESSDEFARLLQEAPEDDPPPTMNLAVLNATVGSITKIKPRKEKK